MNNTQSGPSFEKRTGSKEIADAAQNRWRLISVAAQNAMSGIYNQYPRMFVPVEQHVLAPEQPQPATDAQRSANVVSLDERRATQTAEENLNITDSSPRTDAAYLDELRRDVEAAHDEMDSEEYRNVA